jgi:predicted DNA-binding protein
MSMTPNDGHIAYIREHLERIEKHVAELHDLARAVEGSEVCTAVERGDGRVLSLVTGNILDDIREGLSVTNHHYSEC